jgi:acyl-CoA reductase-like NAD-dependent aldehyde dehydrogenase
MTSLLTGTNDISVEAPRKKYPSLSDPITLEAFQVGVHLLRSQYLGQVYPWVLGGVELMPKHDPNVLPSHYFSTRDPVDRSVVATFPTLGGVLHHSMSDLVLSCYEAGQAFFRSTTPRDRIRLLQEITAVLRERFWLHCAVKAYECGQSRAEQIGETDEEVDFPLANAAYLSRLYASDNMLSRTPDFAGDMNAWRYVPHGVFLNVSPFNFPGAIPVDMATKALAMGNAFIEKSSPKSALSGYMVFDAIRSAFVRLGMPWQGVVNFAPGGADVVHALLSSPYIAGLSFTGSSRVLSDICAKHGKILRAGYQGTRAPLVLGSAETSGVNPFVVLDDAPSDLTAREYIRAFTGRSGQKCSSARVAYIPQSIAQDFLSQASRMIESLTYGDVKKGADIGPLASESDAKRLESDVVHALVHSGIKSYVVKSGCVTKGYDFAPRILVGYQSDLTHGQLSQVVNTELFGPVSTVLVYEDEAWVKAGLLASTYALTASIFTSNPKRALEYIPLLPAGNVYVNRKCTGALVDSEIFGGLRSRSSPSGIKGSGALQLFGSRQTLSGFTAMEPDERLQLLDGLRQQGWSFSKQ